MTRLCFVAGREGHFLAPMSYIHYSRLTPGPAVALQVHMTLSGHTDETHECNDGTLQISGTDFNHFCLPWQCASTYRVRVIFNLDILWCSCHLFISSTKNSTKHSTALQSSTDCTLFDFGLIIYLLDLLLQIVHLISF